MKSVEEGLCFGWNDTSALSDAHYRNGGIICPDVNARKVFTVHLPDGRYEVELDMITWYPPGTRFTSRSTSRENAWKNPSTWRKRPANMKRK